MILNSKIEVKIFSSLLLLLPVLLITGPFLSDLIISILALYSIFYVLKKRDFKIFKNKIILILIFFWLYLIINSYLTKSYGYNAKNVIFYFRFIFFVIAILILIEKNNLNKRFYQSLTIVLYILIVDGFIQFVFGKNILGYEMFCVRDCSDLSMKSMRITGLLDKPIIGSYIMKLLPIVFGLFFFLKDREILSEPVVLFLMIISGLVIYASGERTSFIHFLLFLTILLIYSFYSFRKKIVIISLFTFLIFVLSFFYPSTKFRMIDFTLMQTGLYVVDSSTNSNNDKKIIIQESINVDKKESGKNIFVFSYHHDSHISTALKIFKNSPLIGNGVKSFRFECKKFQVNEHSCTTHPHNVLIQILSELGIIGLIFYFILYFYLIKFFVLKLLTKIKKNIDLSSVFFASSVLINTFPLTPSGNIFNNWLSIMFFLPIGFLIYSIEKSKI